MIVIIIIIVISFLSCSFINMIGNQVCEHQDQVFLISKELANKIMICNCSLMQILFDVCTNQATGLTR